MVQWLRLGPGTDAVEHCQKKNAEIITKLLLFIINSCILPQKSSFIANSGRIESHNLRFGLLFFIYKEFLIRQITISAYLNSCISQLSSVTQSCPTLCDTMDSRMPGFPVHHQLLELAQTQVHQADDAIQQSHPLAYPSSYCFQLVLCHQVAKVLEL